MLKDILDAEFNARQAKANEQAAIDAEHKAIVDGIHAEFDKHRAELSQLKLIGDYGRPEPIRLDVAATSGGITIYLGSQISPERLVLHVGKRGVNGPPLATLQHCREFPYKSESPLTMPGHSPAETMVRGLLSLLVKHIHMEVPCASAS